MLHLEEGEYREDTSITGSRTKFKTFRGCALLLVVLFIAVILGVFFLGVIAGLNLDNVVSETNVSTTSPTLFPTVLMTEVPTISPITSPTHTPTTSPTEDFCGNDEEIRQSIALAFDNSVDNFGVGTLALSPQFINGLTCLPSNLFGALSPNQKDILETRTGIRFDNNGITKVHAEAFQFFNASGVQQLIFFGEGFTEIPGLFLSGFTGLTNLAFVFMGDISADEDLFGNFGPEQNVFLSFARSRLTSFPKFISFQSSWATLSFTDAIFLDLPALRTDAFDGVTADELNLVGTAISLSGISSAEIASILGINAPVTL